MATYVAVFALVLAYVAMVAAYCALRTLAKLRRDTHLLSRGTRGPNGQASLIEVTTRHAELTASVAEQVETLRAQLDSAQLASGGLRHVALVRYDAFAELSGRTSFSLALLDDAGDGVTISAITGREDTRVYAKAVARGDGEHQLSPEERQAVSSAMDRGPRLRRAG
jgi:hypothetical protein